jgi:multiple sugar transport system ATP-binding protein
VALFVGSPPLEFLPGRLELGGSQAGFRVGSASFQIPERLSPRLQSIAAAEMAVRPEHVVLGAQGIAGAVRLVQPVGPSTFVTVAWDGGALVARVPGMMRLQPGEPVGFDIAPEHLLFFDAASGKRID